MSLIASAIDQYLLSPIEQSVPTNPQYQTLSSLLASFFNIAMGFGIGIIIFNLGYGFIQYVMSRGEAKEYKRAWYSVTWSAYGLIIVLASFLLKNLVLQILGANEPKGY